MIKQESGKSTWMCSYHARHPITRKPVTRRRIGIKSKAEAKRVYAQLVVEVNNLLKQSVTPTWERVVEEFIEDFGNRDISKNTVKSYATCLRAHTYELWGDKLITDIKPMDIRKLLKEGLSHRSVSHQKSMYKFLRAAFTFAVESDYLTKMPVPQMKFKIQTKLKAVLNEEQSSAFLNQAREVNSEWYPIWAMALYTGLRNGELFALTWDKIDFVGNRILVSSSWNNKDGFKSTKSGDDRYVEIAEGLLPILNELKQTSMGSCFVLPRLEKWKKGEQARDLRLFLEGMGLPPIRFHDLRGSWATMLMAKGIPPIKVMISGGWKDLKTLRIYINKAGIEIQDTTKTLNFN